MTYARLNRRRRLEIWAISVTVVPRPRKLSYWIWACNTKFSIVLKPAPTWKVPVRRSVTSTLSTMRSSALPAAVERVASVK